MKCKYCQAELLSNSSVCPECGKDNLKDSLKPLKIVTMSLACVLMLVLLVGLVSYGVTGSFIPGLGGQNTDPSGSTGAPDAVQVNTAEGTVTMTNAQMQESMNQIVATMGDHKLTNRDLQMYYWMAVNNYAEGADLTKDLSTQVYDKETGKTYQEYCLEMALESWQEVMLLSDAARNAKFELPKEYKDELDALEKDLQTYAAYYGLNSVDALIQTQYGAGSNFAVYQSYVSEYYLGGLYWSDMIQNLKVTEDQINKYYTDHAKELKEELGVDKESGDLADFRNILILVDSTTVENEDGTKTTTVTDEDWAECLASAQGIYDAWIAAGGTEEEFIKLVAEHSKDTYSVKNEGLYEDQLPGCLNEVDVRHILIFPEGATSSTVNKQEWPAEAWAYAENKATEILNEYLAGEQTEEAFGELAKKHSGDGNASAGGLYTDVYMGQMVKSFQDWCFDSSRKTGDTGIVKTDFGYHVMYFVRSDNEADNWVFGQEHKAGDSAVLKTDDGYQILYYVGGEAAWYRYSRYGAQGDIAAEMLETMRKENPVNFDESKFALTNLPKQ